MPVPGAASISNGVLISLSNLTTIELHQNENTVTIGSGLRWVQVYEYLSTYGLAVSGGRFGDVGVGGLLLGGGVSHFGSQVGWSADGILSYEIALACGDIINVTAKSHPDLFWGLKGGLNNFGIVTRFTLKTFPVTSVYGGVVLYPASEFSDFVTAVANYISPQGGMADSLSAIEPVMAFVPGAGLAQGGTLLFHQGVDPAPASLQNFTAIPALISDISLRSNFLSIVTETTDPTYNSYDYR